MNTPISKADPAVPAMPHPIELISVQINQLFFALNSDDAKDADVDGSGVLLLVRQDPVMVNNGVMSVAVRAMYGLSTDDANPGHPKSPCSFMVELTGKFKTPPDMSVDILQRFQKNGALIILSPFLREHVYSLTGRAGIKPVILPLLQVPIFKMQNESSHKEMESQSNP